MHSIKVVFRFCITKNVSSKRHFFFKEIPQTVEMHIVLKSSHHEYDFSIFYYLYDFHIHFTVSHFAFASLHHKIKIGSQKPRKPWRKRETGKMWLSRNRMFLCTQELISKWMVENKGWYVTGALQASTYITRYIFTTYYVKASL